MPSERPDGERSIKAAHTRWHPDCPRDPLDGHQHPARRRPRRRRGREQRPRIPPPPPLPERPPSDCVHRWQLETPSGDRLISGVCARCGEVRAFLAASDEEPGKGWRGAGGKITL